MTTAYQRSQESIWQLPHSLAVRRLAMGLVSEAQDGVLPDRTQAIHRLAADDPRRATELVLALAQLAAFSLAPTPGPSDDPLECRRLRKAHAAYFRGVRLKWVVDGEREYQKQMKRRQRARRLAAVPDSEVA